MPDSLILQATDYQHQQLLEWRERGIQNGLHDFPMPDYHRLQLEHWVWSRRDRLRGRVMDVGCQIPRRWIGAGYFTLGHTGDTDSDVQGDVTDLHMFAEGELDAIVCTEVLEHCADPFRAVAEMHRVLRPSGLLLVTSPFFWPWHGTPDYPDYWRFTHQGWDLLLRPFASAQIVPCEWTPEGKFLLDLVRRFEGWGFNGQVFQHTAYLCEAIK